MTNVIVITNQKGGVGKTTSCTNLGIGLALRLSCPLRKHLEDINLKRTRSDRARK